MDKVPSRDRTTTTRAKRFYCIHQGGTIGNIVSTKPFTVFYDDQVSTTQKRWTVRDDTRTDTTPEIPTE